MSPEQPPAETPWNPQVKNIAIRFILACVTTDLPAGQAAVDDAAEANIHPALVTEAVAEYAANFLAQTIGTEAAETALRQALTTIALAETE